MSIVVRKFVTPWATWSKRWTDPRMAPFQTPLFLADLARQGVLVGPYMSERWELRDEFVRYPGKGGALAAARELNLEATDFIAARPWVQSQPPIVREGADDLERALDAARAGNLDDYQREVLAFVRNLCARIRAAKAAEPVSREFQAKLDERDRVIDRHVTDLVRAGALGGPR